MPGSQHRFLNDEWNRQQMEHIRDIEARFHEQSPS